MTHEMETTIDFMNNSAKAAGMGASYLPIIEKGIKDGEREILLPPAWKEYPKEKAVMLWEPKVSEQEKYPGRYNFGFLATLAVENKEPIKQYFSIFKLTGANLEQSKALLEGRSVVISDWDNKNGKRKDIIASLDLNKTPKEGENYPVNRIPLADLRVGTLYSKEDVVAPQDKKDLQLKQLQDGEKIDVTLRKYVNKVAEYYDASLQLNIRHDEKGIRLEMTVRDDQGKILRQPSIEPKQATTQTLGMVVGMDTEKAVPENVLKLMKLNKGAEGDGTKRTIPPAKKTPTRA